MTSLKVTTARLFERLRPEGHEGGAGELVVAPGSVEDAAEVLAHAADHGLRVGFLGGATHRLIGGPGSCDVVVSTERMRRVVDWQADDLTIVVEAGMPVADLEAMLGERGQSAVLPEHPGTATVGGTLAVAASGYCRYRYGPSRDRVLQVAVATGYGRVIRAGARVVKSSTGYDLARLMVGSMGALGLIGEVCLKLLPTPVSGATVPVADPATAVEAVYRPLAVVETERGSAVYLGGTEAEIAAQAAGLGHRAEPGLAWPEPVSGPVRVSLRVPPAHVAAGVSRIAAWPGVTFRAQHGVGIIEIGCGEIAADEVCGLRRWAEARSGALVLLAGPGDLAAAVDPWGTPPASLAIQRRIKEAFDPAGILNVGKLPGRI